MKRNRAAFTIVQNEPLFLPKWLDYYGRHFPAGDLYVLDHATADSSTSAAAQKWPATRFVPVHRLESFNHNWLRETVETFRLLNVIITGHIPIRGTFPALPSVAD